MKKLQEANPHAYQDNCIWRQFEKDLESKHLSSKTTVCDVLIKEMQETNQQAYQDNCMWGFYEKQKLSRGGVWYRVFAFCR